MIRTYTKKYAWGRLSISADWSQSSSPIRYATDGDGEFECTPFQVASFRHDHKLALGGVNEWLAMQAG